MKSIGISRLMPALLLPAFIFILYSRPTEGIVSPKDGSSVPEGFRLAKELQRDAFTIRYGWLNRMKTSRSTVHRILLQSAPKHEGLSGTLRIPVIAGLYSDIPDPPVQLADLQSPPFTRFSWLLEFGHGSPLSCMP